MLQVNRCEDKLLLEYIRLGDEEGYYKDWSYKKFMSTMKIICDSVDNVYVNNYDDGDDPLSRAFFLAILIDVDDYKNFNEVFEVMGRRCKDIIRITENQLNGIVWDSKYEVDESLFCELFLTPYFKKLGFNKVRYNHGNKEYGKDYILETTNIFGEIEFYGVQAKAGNISGAASSGIQMIENQINLAFQVPYKIYDGSNIYISKIVIATSGNITENAKEIISHKIDRYKFSNTIFLDKKDFISMNL